MLQLLNAVRTGDRGVFMSYCRDLARQRLAEGYTSNELCGALEAFNLVCFRVLRRDPDSQGPAPGHRGLRHLDPAGGMRPGAGGLRARRGARRVFRAIGHR